MTLHDTDRSELIRTATQWFIRSREDGLNAAETAERDAWLAEEPANRLAFDQVAANWGIVGNLGSTPELLALRRSAFNNAFRSRRRPWSPDVLKMAAAACLCLVVGLALALVELGGMERVYETGPGERHTFALEDNSKISLDESTRLTVKYSGRSRALRLTQGLAEFEVAKDIRRPFTVTAGGRTVVATGTSFSVDLFASRLVVTLLEGRVAVAETAARRGDAPLDPASGSVIELKAAEQLVVLPGQPAVVRTNIDLNSAGAWKMGRIVIDDETLSQAIERINRYAPRRVLLFDRAAAQMRITGVFNAGDLRVFAETAAAQLDLLSVENPRGDFLLYPRSSI